MPALVTIRRWTGDPAAPSKVDITGIDTRANVEDAHSVFGPANPIPIPADGENRGFWVHTQLSADSTPSGTINNIRWHTDGSNNFGTAVNVIGEAASEYVQAPGEEGISGTPLAVAAHPGLLAEPVNVFAFTPVSPKQLAGSLSNPDTGDIPNAAFVYQFIIGDTALPGTTGKEIFTFRYDET